MRFQYLLPAEPTPSADHGGPLRRREACARVKAVDFAPSNVRFDAAFERDEA